MISKNEISFFNMEDALATTRILLRNDYVVMLSQEENLWIVNYEWSPTCNRNDVVFISRDEFEDEFFNIKKDEEE